MNPIRPTSEHVGQVGQPNQILGNAVTRERGWDN